MESNKFVHVKEEIDTNSSDWRTQISPECRQSNINSLLKNLERRFPDPAPESLLQLKQYVETFEGKCFTTAISKDDYIMKLERFPSMDNNHTTGEANFLPSASGCGNQNSLDPASQGMQSQLCNEGKSLPAPLGHLSQVQHQVPAHSMQKTVASGGMQSASLASRLPYVPNRTDIVMTNNVGQSCNMSQNSMGYPAGHVSSNIFADSQRMHGRQHAKMNVAQHQQQSQNAQQYIYQTQLQNQIAKQKQYAHNQPSGMQSHIHQQQQQNLQQTSQMQQYQLSIMQVPPYLQSNQSTLQQAQQSFVQSSPDSIHQQNQQSSPQKMRTSVLQQHPQLVLRQHPQLRQSLQQQKAPLAQHSMSSPHQNQKLLGKQQIETNIQQGQHFGEPCNILDMQQQQQQQQETQQCLVGEQSNLARVQQQQQLLGQQNSTSSFQQQQLGAQCNVSGYNQLPMHILQQSKIAEEQQKVHQASSTMPAISQQQLQIHPAQLQQQMGLQKKQQNTLQREMHQRLYSSSPLLQPQNASEQQKQLCQSQKMPSETSPTSADSTGPTRHTNGTDGNEEVQQKLKRMKEMYIPYLQNHHHLISKSLQIPKPEQVHNRLKKEKSNVENMIRLILDGRNNTSPDFKEKVLHYEKVIGNYVNSVRRRHQQQHNPTGDHSSRTQTSQLQHQNSQMNTLTMQPRNSTLSVTSIQPTAVATIQNESMPSLSTHMGLPSVKSSIMNMLQSSSSVELIHGNGSSSLHQSAVGSPQKVNVNATQDGRFNILSQTDRSTLQPNIDPLNPNSSVLNHKHLKPQELQMLRAQKQQIQQNLMSQQLMNQPEQQMTQQQQQQHQQQKQQQSMQFFARQIPQPYQVGEVNEMKGKQGTHVKVGMLQPQPTTSQPFKACAPFPISSPQSLQAASPQISQHSSPQADQQSMITSHSKAGTPLQSANSPLIAPSPSTPLTPSSIPGEHEKQTSGISSHSNAANSGQTQTGSALHQMQSLVIGTPGISASPLLTEFTSPEKDQDTVIYSKPSATEQPIERLINAVKSMSQKALSAAVSDINSAISLVDMLKGSAPVHGSRSSVGNDLSATAKQRFCENNYISKEGFGMAKKVKRNRSTMFLNIVSSEDSMNDSFRQLNDLEISDLESTATSRIKRPRCEANHALLEEIQEINQQLINTEVDISDEDNNLPAAIAHSQQGTVVKCSYIALGLSSTLKSEDALAPKWPSLPVCLLVPANYPNCSPILLEKMPFGLSKEAEDLLVKARLRFSLSLRCLSQQMTLREMARTWDATVRGVIREQAQKMGGGSFSSSGYASSVQLKDP